MTPKKLTRLGPLKGLSIFYSITFPVVLWPGILYQVHPMTLRVLCLVLQLEKDTMAEKDEGTEKN